MQKPLFDRRSEAHFLINQAVLTLTLLRLSELTESWSDRVRQLTLAHKVYTSIVAKLRRLQPPAEETEILQDALDRLRDTLAAAAIAVD